MTSLAHHLVKVILLFSAPLLSSFAQCDLSHYNDYSPPDSAARMFSVREALYKPNTSPEDFRLARETLYRHGWELFATLFKPSTGCPSQPIWLTWYTKDAINDIQWERKNRLQVPISLEIPQKVLGITPITGAPSKLLAATQFNDSALQTLRTELRGTPSPLILQRERGASSMTGFAPTAVFVKSFWRRLSSDPADPLRLPVWNAAANAKAGGRMLPESDWLACVTVTAGVAGNDHRPCLRIGDPTELSGPVVSKGDFHYIEVESEDFVRMLRPLLDNEDRSKLKVGDFLLLIGFHITTKEIDNWTWSTFWWTHYSFQSDSEKSVRDRLFSNSFRLRHYVASVSLSMGAPKVPINKNPAVFNPYIEGSKINNGTSSHCMTCHFNASIGHDSLWRSGSVQHSRKGITTDKLDRVMRTDFVWLVPSIVSESQ